jgi:hypothetical protein
MFYIAYLQAEVYREHHHNPSLQPTVLHLAYTDPPAAGLTYFLRSIYTALLACLLQNIAPTEQSL